MSRLLADSGTSIPNFDWTALLERLGLPIIVIALLVRRILVIGFFYDQSQLELAAKDAIIAAKDAKIEKLTDATIHEVFPALASATQAAKEMTTAGTEMLHVVDDLRQELRRARAGKP